MTDRRGLPVAIESGAQDPAPIATAIAPQAPTSGASALDRRARRVAGRSLHGDPTHPGGGSSELQPAVARLRNIDPLTGLADRLQLLDRIDEAATFNSEARPLAVIFLDLDRFKAINDTLGHAAGDCLLIEVARRLAAIVGPDDLVARLGGDEFVVLSFGRDRPAVDALSEALRCALAAPIALAGRPVHISASIGIAFAGCIGAIDPIQAADIAMYDAKQHGGNRTTCFEPMLHDIAVRKFELDHDLRAAVADCTQFELVFQPIFEITADAPILRGFEALLRWQHPRLGWVAPNLFIPMAEASGLIVPLGDWVLVHAVAQAQALRDADLEVSLLMTINVSVLQLAHPGFCARLEAVLVDAGVAASSICLEITESMLSDRAIAAVLRDVRTLGVRVAIDDFGTGYSSLSYLRRLPADIVKLDISFLEDAGPSSGGDAFVEAIIELVHAAGMTVIQEGIETAAQLAIARTSGAAMAQGYLLGRPMPTAAALALVISPAPSPGPVGRYRRPRRRKFAPGPRTPVN